MSDILGISATAFIGGAVVSYFALGKLIWEPMIDFWRKESFRANEDAHKRVMDGLDREFALSDQIRKLQLQVAQLRLENVRLGGSGKVADVPASEPSRNKLMERLCKLRDLAKSTDNPHEAAVAKSRIEDLEKRLGLSSVQYERPEPTSMPGEPEKRTKRRRRRKKKSANVS